MRNRTAVAVLAAVVAAAPILGTSPRAAAADPVDLAGAYVADRTGVLAGSLDEVEAALDALYDRTGTGLYVAVVDRFSGAADGQSWADASAVASGLGDDDLLLAIAVDDREYRWSVADVYPLSDAQLDGVAGDRLEPALRDDRWADALVGFADGLGDELEGGPSFAPVLVVAAVVVAIAIGVVWLVRRRSVRRPADGPTLAELDRDAGSLLVALDDALRDAEQELGFAEAQFGAAAVADFRATLADARARVGEAFAIRQRLDDGDPESPDEARAQTARVIELCREAHAALQAQADDFARLRDLERNAATVLESVAAAHAALPERVAAAAAAVEGLSARFGTAAVEPVADSPAHARELADLAATAVADARAALTAGETGAAAIAVRTGQRAVDQSSRLLDAVSALEAELPRVARRLTAAMDDLRADLVEAAGASSGGGAGDASAIAAATAEAERVLAAAADRDPRSALTAVEQADAALGGVLATVRDRRAQADRARTQLPRVQESAVASIAVAQEFVTTRRGGIGPDARTRLAEADRRLAAASALAAADPVAALAAAQQADALADAALRLARRDTARLDPAPGGRGSALLSGLFGDAGASWGGSWGGSWGSSSGSRRRSRSGGLGGGSRRSSTRRPSSRSSSRSRRGGGGRF